MKLIAAGSLDEYLENRAYVIDLRSPEEYRLMHISSAVNIPYENLEDYRKKLPHKRVIVLYCQWGGTSILAGRKLTQYGYDNVVSVNGGIQAYHGRYMIFYPNR